MSNQKDLGAIAGGIIDANFYMVLGTADEGGQPWVSPVYFVADRYTEFYWVSSPDVTHSRNLAVRSQLSIVIFDSQVHPGSGQAVYMTAVAEQLAGENLEPGLDIYSRGAVARSARAWEPKEVRPPALYRLYRATVSQHFILCPRTPGQACTVHGRAFDHRTEVSL